MTWDLSRELADGAWTYPGDPPVRVAAHATMAADGHRVGALELGTHAGTHVDAPAHTEADGETLGAYGPGDLAFAARVADCTDRGPREAIERAALGDLDCGLLVVRTGWGEHWGGDRYLDHPYLAPTAAEALADAGVAVALDAPSPDPSRGESLAAHHALLGAGLPVVENLAGLAALPERVHVTVAPLPVDADGAPARVVARPPADAP